jgi:sugar/nucleoside kinase (ribokinase family)
VRVSLITGETVMVDVVPEPDGEHYLIGGVPPITLPPVLEADAVILSPVIREIEPVAVPEVRGLLVIDLQGFVRTPSARQVGPWSAGELGHLLARADIIKASTSELRALPENLRRPAPGATLVVTHGRRGADVVHDERRLEIAAIKVDTRRTIGAGDTFLGIFVAATLAGCDPLEAGRRAARSTEAFLRGEPFPRFP